MPTTYDTDVSQLTRLQDSFAADNAAREAAEMASQPSRFEMALPYLLLVAAFIIGRFIIKKLDLLKMEEGISLHEKLKAEFLSMKSIHPMLMWTFIFLLIRGIVDLGAAFYLNSGLNLIFGAISFYCCYLLFFKPSHMQSVGVVGWYLVLRGFGNIMLAHLALGEDFWRGIPAMTLAGVPSFLMSYFLPVVLGIYLLRFKSVDVTGSKP